MDLELLSAALRADTADLDVFFEVLGTKLTGVLGDRVRIERQGGGLRRGHRLNVISVHLGDDRLELSGRKGVIVARIAHEVRGVVLRTEEVDLPEWLDRLVQDLEAESRRSASTRAALEALLT
ncbi:MAG: hypothetical protein ACRD1G_14140 [Acidimicrobiales bacterium]